LRDLLSPRNHGKANCASFSFAITKSLGSWESRGCVMQLR
jgi:hypothetical protein